MSYRTPNQPRVIMPLRPNSSRTEVATAKGGEMIGTRNIMCIHRLNGAATFTWIYASKNPSAVPNAATTSPISSVF